jgi:hypothetical protein
MVEESVTKERVLWIAEWILEYGKYAMVAAALYFGLAHAGTSVSDGVSKIVAQTFIDTMVDNATVYGSDSGGPGISIQAPETAHH